MYDDCFNEYYVDTVMCIDGSANMSPFLNEVKAHVISFFRTHEEAMENVSKTVKKHRIKVIVFRAFGAEGMPIEETKFFNMPEEEEEFADFVRNIRAFGGRADASNSLEAIALALKSDWVKHTGIRQRQEIMLFSNVGAVPLGECKDHPDYPQGMPEDLERLHQWWEGEDDTFKGSYISRFGRLVAFIPEVSPWTDMMSWNRYWPSFSEDGHMVTNELMEQALDLFAGDVV